MASPKAATKIIALEEAFLYPKLLDYYDPTYVQQLQMIRHKLTDVGSERILRMDAAGIDLQVLSHVAPGVQTLDRERAIGLSCEVNDWLADIINQYPTRFAGFATLATQSPQDAARELERAVAVLRFKGALINGHTNGRYLDEPEFGPILEQAEALDVPIYLHPYTSPEEVVKAYYPTPGMAQGWGWMVDTGTHVLRLMANGVFDRFPTLKIIIGHMGELIPFNLHRLNKGMTLASWLVGSQANQPTMKMSVLNYLKQNVYVTTSGSFDQVALQCAIAQLGIDNMMFSVDDPFADNVEAVEFLAAASLSTEDKEKLAHGNAERVLRLDPTAIPAPKNDWSRQMTRLKARAKSTIASALLKALVK